MDLDSLEDPNNSNCCINSQINEISSTSGIEVPELNKSTLTKVQEQNKTENVKIVEISKQQVPVKPIIATTSVVNSPKVNEKNIDPHYISSSLDNSNSTRGIEVTKLNKSTLTKVQDPNKTENVKIVELSKHQVAVKPIIETTSVVNSPKINEKIIDSHYISSSLDNSNSTRGIEVTKLNKSTTTKVQDPNKIENVKIVELSKHQVAIKPIIETTSVINSPKINEKNIDTRYISSSLDNNSSTSGIEVPKLNKSTLTKVQKLNKTEHFKIVELSKYQVPVKPIIATTSVVNSPKINEKNIDPHYISSKSDIEVSKLKKSTLTKVQEQNKTKNFKIVEISKHQVPVKPIIATTSVVNSPKLNEKNIDLHYISSSSLDNSSSTSGKQIPKLNKSTLTKVQEQNKRKNFKIFEIFKQLVPIKPIIATTSVVNSPKINEKNIEVNKLNEFTITKEQEQNKTENVKMGDISKHQVPVKPIIATTSVVNSPKINEKNIDPHYINSSLDNSSSASSIEVPKLNKSTLTKVQEQNKTERFKIVEISKHQVPVKPIIATTSVVNSPKINEKNIDPHNINSSLDNSSSASSIEVPKLNKSTLTKVQEQNKTEKFKIVEISKHQVPVKPIIATTSVVNSPKINEKIIDSHYINSSLDNSSSASSIEVPKLNKSTPTKEQEQNKTDNLKTVELSKHQGAVKPVIATNSVVNSPKINKKNLEVPKLNKSTLTKVQEQNKTEKFKIVEISKHQVPVKPIIATTSVVNSPKINEKIIDPHYINSSLDNSSSASSIEVPKLNKSTPTKEQEQNKTDNLKTVELSKHQVAVKPVIATNSVVNSPKINEKNLEVTKLNEFTITKVQEQNKTENFKIVDKNKVEISVQRGMPLTKMIASTFLMNAPKKNVNHKDLHNSQSDLSTLLNNNNSTRGIEVTKLNESTSTKVQELNKTVHFKTVDNNDVKISNKQLPLKKMAATTFVLNTFKKNENNIYLKPNNYSLNLEKIAVPKAVLSNIKLIPTTFSSQVKKPPTVSFMSATTLINSKTTNITRLQPKFYPGKITNNKCVPTLKPGFKIISSNDPKSKMFLLPKGVNYLIKTVNKDEVKNQPLPSLSSTSTLLKPLNSIVPISVAEKFDTIKKPKIQNKNSKFVFSCKEFQHQRFKVLSNEKNIIDENVKGLFESNTHFELIFPHSSKPFLRNLKKSLKPHTDTSNPKVIKNADTSESDHIQQEREQSFITSSLNEHKNSIDFGVTSGENKCVPHTITSKDVINNHKNVVIENNKTILNTNVKKELRPPSGFIQLSSRPESSMLKTYGNFSNKELNNVRLVPYTSINQPQAKGDRKQFFIKIVKTDGSTSKSTIATVSSDKIMKVIPTKVYATKNPKINIAAEENQNKIPMSKPNTIKLLLPNEIKKEKPDPAYCERRKLVRCQYEFCRLYGNEPDMIDNLYCSLGCKKFHTKLKIANDNSVVVEQPQEEIQNKPVIDRKMLLAKLKSRINKRKQCLPSFQKEYEAQHVDLAKVENPDNESCKMPSPIPVTVKHSFQISQNKRKSSKLNESTTVVQNCKTENLKIASYLEHTDYIPAPKKLFDNPFPYESNPFKVGQRLEGIDPEHEALFCVMSVVEVVGYRIKLHFDGYPDIYDFWVNANCPDLFFPRWCEQNSRILQPPKNYNLPFNWTDYLKMPGVLAAPKWNFPSAIDIVNRNTDHSFCIGAKLEALDKLTRTLPKQLICVATVADIVGNRIRIHFDGWTDDFDYWTDITSTNIHPVGWCDKNGRTLCPPSGYDNCRGKKPFLWSLYLQETCSEPVPEDAFVRRPLREFTNSMAIEVVDIANPLLVRIAKVVDVKGDELKILYDGFDSIYAYWIEDDSPNIHPLGWCLKTNHPIELFKVNAILWSCRVPGCNGKGNTNSSKSTHVFAKDCPYEFESWKKSISGLINIPDRLKLDDIPVSVENFSKTVSIPQEDKKKLKSKLNKIKSYNSNRRKKRIINNKLKKNLKKKIPNGRSKTVYTRAVEAMNELEIIKGVNDYTSYGYGSLKLPRLNVWTRHNVLQGIPIFSLTDVRKWSVKEVATFVERVVSNNYTDNNPSERIKISQSFIKQEIDGDVFLMLTQEDLTNILNIPLGPALKLHNAIVVLRQRVSAFDIANGLL